MWIKTENAIFNSENISSFHYSKEETEIFMAYCIIYANGTAGINIRNCLKEMIKAYE